MVGHGLQKLNGSFGGPGLEGTEQAMGAMGIHPAKQQALAAALSETVGGGLTAAGLFSPLGPAMVIGTMAVAIQKVHGKNGPWITKGGFEYNAVIIAAALALASDGPGALSFDGIFGHRRSGFRWALASLVLGLGGAAVTLAISDRFAPESDATGDVATEHVATEHAATEPVATEPVATEHVESAPQSAEAE
jgi:putative oxidoreductase